MSKPNVDSENFDFEDFLAKVKEDSSLKDRVQGMDHEALSKFAEDKGFNQAASQILETKLNASGLLASTCTRTSRTNLTRVE
jgi:hypothetical protein